MQNNLNLKIEEIFKLIGEFGPYQLLIFLLVGITACIPGIVGYSYSFYAAVPEFRCKIPDLANDTYEIWGNEHEILIEKYIPLKSESNKYDKCNLKIYGSNETDFALQKCDRYVYSRQYYDKTIITEA
jgi:hypothetical protein